MGPFYEPNHERRGLSMVILCRRLICVAALVAAMGCRARAPQPAFNPVPPEGCALYVGSSMGNDEADMRLALCPGPSGLVGWTFFASSESGWSMRSVEGSTQADGSLVLRDTSFLENHPSRQWELCLVDRYRLRLTGDGAVLGEYASTQCQDNAMIALERMK